MTIQSLEECIELYEKNNLHAILEQVLPQTEEELARIPTTNQAEPNIQSILTAKQRLSLFVSCFSSQIDEDANGLKITNPLQLQTRKENQSILDYLRSSIAARTEKRDYSVLPEFFHMTRFPYEVLEEQKIVSSQMSGKLPSADTGRLSDVYASIKPESRYCKIGFALNYTNLPHLTTVEISGNGHYVYWLKHEIPIQLFDKNNKPLFNFMVCEDKNDYPELRKYLNEHGHRNIKILTMSELNQEAFAAYNGYENRQVPHFCCKNLALHWIPRTSRGT